MFSNDKIIEIREYLDDVEPNTKVYLGSDSVKYKKDGAWYAKYVIVLVVHLGQKHGAKVFSYEERERVYDKKQNSPRLRLMTEVYKLAECYLAMQEILEPFDMDGLLEVHLDLNSDARYPSNAVVREAVGYIKGITGLDAMIKPDSQVASHCADHGAKHGGKSGEFGKNRHTKPMRKSA